MARPLRHDAEQQACSERQGAFINIERGRVQGGTFFVGEFNAEAHHATGDLDEVVGEIFRAHAGKALGDDVGWTEEPLSNACAMGSEAGIIDHAIELALERRNDFAAENLGDSLTDADEALAGLERNGRVERADGTAEYGGIGDDIGAMAADDLADGDDGGPPLIGLARYDLVDRGDQMGRHGDRVDGEMGPGSVASSPAHLDGKILAAGSLWAGHDGDLACGQGGIDVEGQDGLDAFHRAGGDHVECAMAGFLGGLKDGPPADGQARGKMQVPRRAKDDGGVGIVAAGVHDAGSGGTIGGLIFLRDGKGVDIGTQGDDRSVGGLILGDEAHFAGAESMAYASGGELLTEKRGGGEFLTAEFGMAMKVAADFGEVRDRNHAESIT